MQPVLTSNTSDPSFVVSSNSGSDGVYNLFDNNCLHYVNEILSFSDNINNDIDTYVITNRRDAPCAYYDDLIELIG